MRLLPAGLKVELWNNDTGELLCRQRPVYGATGGFVKDKGTTYDEAGYIATPPCLWGSAKDGLQAPIPVAGMTIKVVAVTNNTYGHHGEMALPEMSFVDIDPEQPAAELQVIRNDSPVPVPHSVTTTASGLKIEVLRPAPSGANKPAAADRVRVNYEGRVRTDRPAAAQLAAQSALENPPDCSPAQQFLLPLPPPQPRSTVPLTAASPAARRRDGLRLVVQTRPAHRVPALRRDRRLD